MSVEFKTLTFPNTEAGRQEKNSRIQWYASQGWEVVSENIKQGEFRGGRACLLFFIFVPCAFLAGSTDGEIIVTLKRASSNSSTTNDTPSVPSSVTPPVERSIFYPSSSQKSQQSALPENRYEPIIGVETDALIKRAFLFLEDGQFNDAGRYLEQALNQDAEDPRIHFGLLMLEHNVHNADELIGKLATPLEDEKLFQRALRFAHDEYKAQLESYARASHDKLEQERIAAEAIAEQKRLAEEAERERQRIEEERKRAEREAENERLYQEMLALREKAASVNELEELLRLVYRLRPYKDSEQIYNDVNEALQTERKYQNARRELQNASRIDDLKKVISSLEELDDYKDSEKLFEEAQSKLEDLEERARKNKKIAVTVCVIMVLGVGSFFGWKWHKDKEATTARQNAITAFFEGRYDEANEAITAITALDNEPATHAALLYVQTLMRGGTSQTFIENPDISKRQDTTAFNSSFKEANSLAEKYTHTLNGDKFLGDAYLHGWGYDKDMNKALGYFNRSAESNDIYSQIKIAEIYEGRGNNQEALKWYEKLADSGNAQAAEKVRELKAKMTTPKPPVPSQQEVTLSQEDTSTRSAMVQEWYEWGCDFLDSKNYSDAVKYFRLAANENYAPAQDKLAWMYQKGWGVEQSYTQAVSWFRKAAEQGNTEALASMGLMYLKGWGVPQNYDTALEWYGKAAAKGSEVAQRRINSIQLLKVNMQKLLASTEQGIGFPIPGTIFAETLSVRQSPATSSKRIKTLKTGHPVSVSNVRESDNDYWFYVKTASGTEGWVLAGYVNLIDRDLSYQEISNKKHTLPASGYVTTREDTLNLRNIPTVKGSQIIEKLDSGTYFTAYEVFAGDTIDWYRIRTTEGDEGWVSGRFIQLR